MPPNTDLARALSALRAGDLKSAEQACRAALERNANDVGALMIMGMIEAESGNLDAAEWNFARAAVVQPQRPDAHFNLALVRARQGRLDEALGSLDRTLQLDPNNQGALSSRAEVLLKLSRPREAVAAFDAALAKNANAPDLWRQRGMALQDVAEHAAALDSHRNALALAPNDADAHNGAGVALTALGRLNEAVEALSMALALDPTFAAAYSNRGIAFTKQQQPDAAEADHLQALALDPDNPRIIANYVEHLHRYARYRDAEDMLQRLAMLDPVTADFLLGNLMMDQLRLDEARGAFDRVLAREPEHAAAHWCRGLLELLGGDLENGFADYEWRLRTVAPRNLPGSEWDPNAAAQRTLYLYAETGFGDTLQHARYAPLLIARGHRVILDVQPPLAPLFRSLHPDMTVIAHGDPLPDYDAYCALPSLPHKFGTSVDTIPAPVPYVAASAAAAAKWRRRLEGLAHPRIGLCWSGNPAHERDVRRSIPFTAFIHAFEGANASLVSLQKELRPQDAEKLAAEPRIIDFTAELADYNDTAALVGELDLVVTVDTSIAHLAGALGKPVWLLLPYSPDWRWMLKREDSPWYPSARLFRQASLGDWEGVLARVKAELAQATGAAETNAEPPLEQSSVPCSIGAMDEFERRKAVIAARQTDLERWSDPRQLEAAWEARAVTAAQLIPFGARVGDIGCGAMRLEAHLPFGCAYAPCDVVARDQRTVVADLNGDGIPPSFLQSVDLVAMLGVWEYLYEPQKTFAALAASGRSIVTSYCPVELSGRIDRRAVGWVNDFSVDEFIRLATAHGYRVALRQQIDDVQYLFKFVPAERNAVPALKRVHVASYFNANNFGDRLGYHVLTQLLPAHAQVTWGTLEPQSPIAPDTDLLIVGIGNSLFGNLLSEQLIASVKNAKASIGIFGTQYRQDLPRAALDRLVASLTHWYARYQDDVYLYGRDAPNVSHLGDWLINAFPMARGSEDKLLTIPPDVVKMDVPLDRFIQFIQLHRRVMSSRLHPLLCAMTSAEQVGYVEQREMSGRPLASGKFRSLLMDIFDRSYPENVLWPVERDRVVAYKAKVAANTDALRQHIAELLV